MICLDRSYLGTEKHLLVDPECLTYQWVNNRPEGSWGWGYKGNQPGLEGAAKIFKYDISQLVPIKYQRAAKLIWGKPSDIRWNYVMPSTLYEKNLKIILKQLCELYTTLKDSNYLQTHGLIFDLVGRLVPATIDNKKLQSFLNDESSASPASSLKTFEGTPDVPYYDYCKTITGRAVIKKGPQILTLPSKYRSVIVSRNSGSQVVQVDFISLEPRIALLTASKNIQQDDVYAYLKDEIFGGNVTRSQVKLATLCGLYGVSIGKLQKLMPSSNAVEIVNKIKKYFNIPHRNAELKDSWEKQQRITNYFGRPIIYDEKPSEHVLYNHYIQSTAVDASICGFHNLLNILTRENIEVLPYFLLHDALIMEVKNEDIATLENLCNKGVNIDNLGNFPLSLETISS
tara:strand:+ start:8996 stop:10195 length:1200 start_codon:yes stop_codon:yes gene_type:complete